MSREIQTKRNEEKWREKHLKKKIDKNKKQHGGRDRCIRLSVGLR